MIPSLFVSHGSPMLALTLTPTHDFLARLGRALPRPRAILVASAHWETETPMVNAVAHNDTIHDFFGFPKALFELTYPAPGDPALAERIVSLLRDAGFPAGVDSTRGLDHGAWVPLLLTYPEADVPVLQLSVQPHLGPIHHHMIGRVLARLRDEGVLILGSGSFTHDLRRFRGQRVDSPETEDVTKFSTWMDERITIADLDALFDYRARAPHAADEHPTEEHLLPLFTAIGAAGDRPTARRLHSATEHGILRMDAYAFGCESSQA